MKTVIDIAEDRSSAPDLPDGTHIEMDGDEVVLYFYEVELRLSLMQFIAMTEAMGRFLHLDERSVDVDEPYDVHREHYNLRRLFARLIGDTLGAATPDELRKEVRLALKDKGVDPERFDTLEERARKNAETILELRAEIAALKGAVPRRSRKRV